MTWHHHALATASMPPAISPPPQIKVAGSSLTLTVLQAISCSSGPQHRQRGRETVVSNPGVDTFLEASITQENQRRCSLVRRDGPRPRVGRSATWREAAVLSGQARTVRGTGPDGPRPGTGARVRCLTAGRSTP
jgi:hypothetical protein